MTGLDLKSYLAHLDVSFAETARKLGMQSQGLDGVFKTKDIKTGLLERLSKIYKVPISYFYGEGSENPDIKVIADGTSAASVNGNATVYADNALATERIHYLEAIIVEKDARIKELKECLEIIKNR